MDTRGGHPRLGPHRRRRRMTRALARVISIASIAAVVGCERPQTREQLAGTYVMSNSAAGHTAPRRRWYCRARIDGRRTDRDRHRPLRPFEGPEARRAPGLPKRWAFVHDLMGDTTNGAILTRPSTLALTVEHPGFVGRGSAGACTSGWWYSRLTRSPALPGTGPERFDGRGRETRRRRRRSRWRTSRQAHGGRSTSEPSPASLIKACTRQARDLSPRHRDARRHPGAPRICRVERLGRKCELRTRVHRAASYYRPCTGSVPARLIVVPPSPSIRRRGCSCPSRPTRASPWFCAGHSLRRAPRIPGRRPSPPPDFPVRRLLPAVPTSTFS